MPRRKFTAEFKARILLDMLTNNKSLSQAGREIGIQGSVLSRWRKEFLERAPQLFEQPTNHPQSDQRIAELERRAGRLEQQLAAAKAVLADTSFPSGGKQLTLPLVRATQTGLPAVVRLAEGHGR
jgi:transposase